MNSRLIGCFDSAVLYKPQWAYSTPDGYRDEPFLVNFTFDIPADGRVYQSNPWQLDDDVPYLIRGILFNQISPGGQHPALVRVFDTQGNPMSKGLALGLGAWGDSGLNGINAFGFPIEPDNECAPGGALLFDFQVSFQGGLASFTHVQVGAALVLVAGVYGTGGNAFTIQVTNGGALSVSVIGNAVNVTINTGVSTFDDVAAAINADPAALELMTGYAFGVGSTVITAFGPSPLAGGTAAQTPTIKGCIIGVKRFKGC